MIDPSLKMQLEALSPDEVFRLLSPRLIQKPPKWWLKEHLRLWREEAEPDHKEASVNVAAKIASFAFQGKRRKRASRKDSIEHALGVAAQFADTPVQKIIALLHDLIEDTRKLPKDQRWTLEDLSEVGFSARVINAVGAMTRGVDEPYFSFIQRLSVNSDAVLVKIADLKDNMKDILTDLDIGKAVSDAEKERVRKYALSKSYLEAVRDGGVTAESSMRVFVGKQDVLDPVAEQFFDSILKGHLLEKYFLPKSQEKNFLQEAFDEVAERRTMQDTESLGVPTVPLALAVGSTKTSLSK